MSNTNIQLRKSGVTGNVPDSLAYGELALNYADGKLYYKNGDGVITYISSGATTNSFATINSNSSLVIATSNTDILSFGGANGISINTNTVSKVITIDGKDLENRIIHLEEWDYAQNDIVSAISAEAFLAHDTANLAYNQANSAITLAQEAYDYANTISGGATPVSVNYLAIEKQLYTANASQTNFYAQYTAPYVTVVINGSTIDASEYSTSTANTVVLNNPASANDIVDITGFVTVNSNTVSFGGGGAGTDQWVRDTANSATANTIITQGVDAWQNTQIIAVNDFAAGAYNKANTVDYVNSLVVASYTQANNANNLAQSAYNSSNNVNSFAQSAYDTANGANGLAAGAFNKANNALPLTGGTVSGNVTFSQDVIITGNLYLGGNTTTISTNNITLNDSLIYLADANPANTVDIGIVGHFVQGKYQHTGVVRNHLNGNWVFFSNVSTEPTTVVNFAEANLVYDSITTGGVITPTATINGKDWQAVNNTQNTNITTANNAAWAAYAAGNTNTTNITLVNQFAQGAYNTANGANGLASGAYNKANNALANTGGTITGDLTVTGNVTTNNIYGTAANTSIIAGVYTTTFDNTGKITLPGMIVFADATTQNTAFIGNGVDQIARTTANGANGLAAGAYNKANTAFANTTGTFAGDLTTTGNIIISTATSSYSVATGSLRVNGGVGVTGNVYADKIYVNGLYWASNGNVISTSSGTTSTNQFNIFKFVATSNQTIFSGPDSASVSLNYTAGAIIVTLNGLTLKPGTDYTADNGTSLTLAVPADLNDELNIYGFTSTTVNTSNTLSVFAYTASAMQTSFGGVDINGNSLSYVPGALFTTLNGITLRNGVDYTAANGSYINLTFSAAANDEVVVYTFGAFNVANTYTIAQADAKFSTAGKSLAINFFRS